jgi:hypothetical protein
MRAKKDLNFDNEMLNISQTRAQKYWSLIIMLVLPRSPSVNGGDFSRCDAESISLFVLSGYDIHRETTKLVRSLFTLNYVRFDGLYDIGV